MRSKNRQNLLFLTIHLTGAFSMCKINFRKTILESYNADTLMVDELIHYNQNQFNQAQLCPPFTFPLEDEQYLTEWNKYIAETQKSNLLNMLQSNFIQFHFPVKEGISQTEHYKIATRRGVLPKTFHKNGFIKFEQPDNVRLIIHESLAGNIPVFIAKERDDFILLVRVFTKRNEPKPIPVSMGACMVAGFNNWNRIHQLQKIWETENPADCSEAAWQVKFKEIIPQKELYQDKFIILSNSPYSGVPAKELGLTEEKWRNISLKIRLEHECAHYFTRRFFSSMQNNILDELIADYMGITTALGHYRADWFLKFLGLENFPEYRKGGRLENYRGNPPLTDSSFKILQALVKDGAENLERFSNVYLEKNKRIDNKTIMLLALTQLTIEELASSKSFTFLQEAFREAKHNIEHAR